MRLSPPPTSPRFLTYVIARCHIHLSEKLIQKFRPQFGLIVEKLMGSRYLRDKPATFPFHLGLIKSQ